MTKRYYNKPFYQLCNEQLDDLLQTSQMYLQVQQPSSFHNKETVKLVQCHFSPPTSNIFSIRDNAINSELICKSEAATWSH